MKNNLLKAMTLFCALLALSGCNKEGTRPSQNGNEQSSRNPIEQLRSFREQIETFKTNPGAKNSETITIDDALWDIENNFNLSFSDAESYYSQTKEHEFTLYLPITTDQRALVSDAVNLYFQVTEQARDAYANDGFSQKGFISLSVTNTEETDGLLQVTFSGKTGERSPYNPPIAHVDGPFGTDDNWLFAAPMGKCDDPDIPSGADEQLQEHLYAELIEPYVETGESVRNIYIDRKRFIFDGTTYPGVYYTTDPNHLCIEHEYMNDYYYTERQIITQTIPNQYHLEGYAPISIAIEGIELNNNALTHRNEIEYGVRIEVSKDEFGEIEDLLIQQ
jgi:hypothetical protein